MKRFFLIFVSLLILCGNVYGASVDTSLTAASVIITRARYILNEATADYWADAELLSYIVQGTLDIVARTRCLEGEEIVSLAQSTVEYDVTGPYIAISTVVYNDQRGTRKGLVRKNPQSISRSRDLEPSFWYDYGGYVGVFPALKVVTDAGLAIGTTVTAVSSDALVYIIGDKIYTKSAVDAGTAPGDDVVPTAKYGAVAFDIDASGTINAVEAYGNSAGYTTAINAVLGLPHVSDGRVRLGYVTATKSDGAFTFGTTALNAANSTVAYTDIAPTITIYYVQTPTTITQTTDTVLVPAVYDRALVLYVASQALLKQGSYAKSGRLIAEYLAELERYRSDFIDTPREPESNVTR
uniref:Tail protein n=1 Tax=viral metagenome TaxID=1070528 RepID=A0A6M3J2Z9_9ZZZZ